MIGAWRNVAGTERVLDVNDHLRALTTDVMAIVGFSASEIDCVGKIARWAEAGGDNTPLDAMPPELVVGTDELRPSILEFVCMAFGWPLKRWRWLVEPGRRAQAMQSQTEFIKRLVKRCRKRVGEFGSSNVKANESKARSVIELLLAAETGGELTDDEVVDEAKTMLFGKLLALESNLVDVVLLTFSFLHFMVLKKLGTLHCILFFGFFISSYLQLKFSFFLSFFFFFMS